MALPARVRVPGGARPRIFIREIHFYIGRFQMLKGLFIILFGLIGRAIGNAIEKRINKNNAGGEGWICPKCSHYNPGGSAVCGRCGEEKKEPDK